jgi:hypothetical protein
MLVVTTVKEFPDGVDGVVGELFADLPPPPHPAIDSVEINDRRK